MKIIVGTIGLIGFFVILLVVSFYPEIPRSFAGWLAMIILGIPTWIFLEWVGNIVLNSKVFENSSSFTRIFLGVPTLILLMGVGLVVVTFVNKFISTVGG